MTTPWQVGRAGLGAIVFGAGVWAWSKYVMEAALPRMKHRVYWVWSRGIAAILVGGGVVAVIVAVFMWATGTTFSN